jgi:hypothetical protein
MLRLFLTASFRICVTWSVTVFPPNPGFVPSSSEGGAAVLPRDTWRRLRQKRRGPVVSVLWTDTADGDGDAGASLLLLLALNAA